MNAALLQSARTLHRFRWLRRLARRIARGWTISQPFHDGVICLDAVEHSWAWTGSRRLENFERPVQDRLVELARDRPRFVDIGCSIGVMTLSVLLRVPAARAVSVDANARAAGLLRQSLHRNGLESRAEILAHAVSSGADSLPFATEGSFTGHADPQGAATPAVPLAVLLQRHAGPRCVIKIDIEGYEAELADSLATLPALPGSVLALELHPAGFNGIGDPNRVLAALRSRGDVQLTLLGGGAFTSVDTSNFSQIEARWSE